LPDVCARVIVLSSEHKFLLVIMAQFLRNKKVIEQEPILESDLLLLLLLLLSRIRPLGLFWFRIYFLKLMNLLDSW
jgi:hypothetical protein